MRLIRLPYRHLKAADDLALEHSLGVRRAWQEDYAQGHSIHLLLSLLAWGLFNASRKSLIRRQFAR